MSWVISAGYASVRLRNRTEIMMPWTEITRKRYERNPMGYSSDVTDGNGLLSVDCFRVATGSPARARVLCATFGNAIRYIAASGCAWSLLPKDFPPVSTVRCYFHRWRDSCMRSTGRRWPWYATHRAEAVRPQGVFIESVRTTENTSLSGFDAGRKIKGRKRHIMTDTCGRLVAWSHCAFIRPMFRPAMGRPVSLPGSIARPRSCATSLPMKVMPDRNCARR